MLRRSLLGRLIASALAIAAVNACGSAPPPARPTSPFTEEDARYFDDAVDLIRDPSILDGEWQQAWRREFSQRVARADVVAIVTIATVRTDVDLERRNTLRLIGSVAEALHGSVPNDELSFRTREGENGFAGVQANLRHIEGERFVAFVKWVDERGALVARWHLAPATDPVLRRARALATRRETGGPRRTVYVHRE